MAKEEKKEPTTNALTVQEKNITDNVLARVNDLEKTGGLNFPANYSYANALKSAWLILQNTVDREKRPVLQTCSKESIANTLLDMVIQGLSPAKKQCYFIAYGKQLQLSRSYLGTIAVTKRLKGIKEVFANPIYEGDEFEYKINLETGLKELIKHNQKFENINPAKIKGAYACIIREDLPPFVEVMNIDQIKKAWAQGTAYSSGKSTAHNNFTDEMAKKSVINRACKIFFNTSDDSDILIHAINSTKDLDSLPETDYEIEVEEAIEENANKELIDIKTESNPSIPSKEEQQKIFAKEMAEAEADRGF